MSQKASRKGVVNEEKEKTDTPVKDMKKKMAANAEKEKQSVEKKDAEKPAEKATEKNDKAADKADKSAEKKTEKTAEKRTEKPAERKTEKPADKKTEKTAEKKTEKVAEKTEKKSEAPVEKKEESKDDKGGKSQAPDSKKPTDKPKQNGKDSRQLNGNGSNGTVSAEDDDDDAMVIDEQEHDEMFPELAYDDTSDAEFEPAPEPSRSFTRRSQAKVTRTPETPRPASDKQAEREPSDDSKDSKVLKLKEDAPPSTDRKLRSADSPKPQDKKEKEAKKDGESETKEEKENGDKTEKEVDVVIEIEAEGEPRKPDTNYSKSRVKVSPYRRSGRLADQTTTSVMANYTGNNTTMEMDITETTSSFMSEEPSLDDSTYLAGLRGIRGRRSYKQLGDLPPRPATAARLVRTHNASGTDQPTRPTAPVVGRKRKPESDVSIEVGTDAASLYPAAGKRVRLLERLAGTLRRGHSTPLPARRAAEIVGINTDLPLTAPVAQADPEALKTAAPAPGPAPLPVPLAPADAERDSKRCIVM